MSGNVRTTVRSRVRSSSAEPEADPLHQEASSNRHRTKNETNSTSNFKLLFAITFFFFFFIIIFFLVHHFVTSAAQPHLPRVVTPFPAPKIMDLPQFQGEHKESLYWGTYRPHLYLGIRARTPQSLMAGLMWIGVKDGSNHLRHVCRQEDALSAYGWTKHNGRDYGHQVLVDHGMILTTKFIKSKGESSGYGGDWAVRIDAQIDKSKWNEDFGSDAQLFFYLADEDGNVLDVGKENLNIRESSLLASGSRTDIGDWQLHLKSTDDLKLHYSGFHTPHFHNLSDLVEENLASQTRKHAQMQLPDSSDDSPNVLVFQIIGGFPFTTDIVFISATNSESSRVEKRVNSLTGDSLSDELKYKEQAYDEKIEKIFNLAEKVDSESVSVGKAAVGSLLGGIGYFYGQSKIDLSRTLTHSEHAAYISYWPAELYTAVPCRSTFPRGFLWDEGFHQLVIWRWDIHISLDIIGHWLDLMNIDGWIPREQILGAEALSRIPEEYVPQHPTNGNPPTLFLALNGIINGLKNNEFNVMDRSEISLFLERAFGRLDAWFQWYNETQSGEQMSSYYWRGRDNMTTLQLNPQTLTSGLDDYPRASHPSSDERHLDLRCWVLLAAQCMRSIEELLNKETKPEKNYGSTVKLLSDREILNKIQIWLSMEIGKKFELLMEKAVSFKLGALMLKPSRSVLVIYSTSAERPPPEPPPQAVMNIRIGWLLLRPSSTLQETEFGFSSLELGTERPPRKPPWVNSGWVGLASFELCFSICVLVVVFVCYLSCFVCCVLFLYLVDFKSLYHVSLLCWHHRSFIVLYEDEYRFPTFAIYQLFFVQNDKVKKSETKCSRNERDVVEKMIRNWIEKKTLDSHISFVRYRRWKLLMDWLLEYEIWLKSSYLSAKFLGIANHALMHFDDVYGAYFDFGNHTEKVQLKWKELKAGHNHVTRQLVREVLERPVLKLVPQIGYVNFFPFMGRIIPSGSWILEKQLELISNRSLLWTDYGLRSLAKTSSLYMKYNTEHEAPYWRGTIWINMNYRVLSALHHYSEESGPYQDKAKTMYKELRSNLIRNMVHNYQQTGFLWEQYDQVNGKGKGAHPFTGWTSTVVLMMAEAYDII